MVLQVEGINSLVNNFVYNCLNCIAFVICLYWKWNRNLNCKIFCGNGIFRCKKSQSKKKLHSVQTFLQYVSLFDIRLCSVFIWVQNWIMYKRFNIMDNLFARPKISKVFQYLKKWEDQFKWILNDKSLGSFTLII